MDESKTAWRINILTNGWNIFVGTRWIDLIACVLEQRNEGK